MKFENEHPNGKIHKKRKPFRADEKNVVEILLSDDSLEPHGLHKDEMVEVEIGEVSPADLAAILTADGRWFAGNITFAEGGVILASPRSHCAPLFLPTEEIASQGRIFPRRAHVSRCVPINIWSAAITHIDIPASPPVMTWQTDAQGVVVHADPLCREFLGLDEAELRAGVWKSRIHPDDRANYLRARDQAIAENIIYRNSVRILNARDEYCLISVVLVPYRNKRGVVTGWQAVAELEEERIKRSA